MKFVCENCDKIVSQKEVIIEGSYYGSGNFYCSKKCLKECNK